MIALLAIVSGTLDVSDYAALSAKEMLQRISKSFTSRMELLNNMQQMPFLPANTMPSFL